MYQEIQPSRYKLDQRPKGFVPIVMINHSVISGFSPQEGPLTNHVVPQQFLLERLERYNISYFPFAEPMGIAYVHPDSLPLIRQMSKDEGEDKGSLNGYGHPYEIRFERNESLVEPEDMPKFQ